MMSLRRLLSAQMACTGLVHFTRSLLCCRCRSQRSGTYAQRMARISATMLPVLASLALALAGAVVASQPVMLPGQVQLFTPWHSSVNKSSPHSDYYPRCALPACLA